jgi:hypothetical protein
MVGQSRDRHQFAGGLESSERVMRSVTGTAVCLHLLHTSSTAISFFANGRIPIRHQRRLCWPQRIEPVSWAISVPMGSSAMHDLANELL